MNLGFNKISFSGNNHESKLTRDASEFANTVKTTYNDVLNGEDKFDAKEVVTGGAIGAGSVKLASLAKGSTNVAKAGSKLLGEATEQVAKRQGAVERLLANTASKLGAKKGLGFLGKAIGSKAVLSVMKPIVGVGSILIVGGQLLSVANVAAGASKDS